MKFRMLTKEEMEIFDEDFKYFLIANGVANEEWLEMNEKNLDRATKLVELFSDTVLQKVYEKIRFIEHRSDNSCLVFKFNADNIELISLNSSSEKISLNTPESIHDALINHPKDLTLSKTQKAYTKNREKEMHGMIMQGCVNSSEAFWVLLERLID